MVEIHVDCFNAINSMRNTRSNIKAHLENHIVSTLLIACAIRASVQETRFLFQVFQRY